MLIGEEGVTAEWWDIDGEQDGAEIGLLEEGDIAVPSTAEVHPIISFGHDLDHLWMSLHAFDERMGVELAEMSTETNLSVRGEVLVGEIEHVVLKECVPDLRNQIVRERGRQIDPTHHRSERARHGLH